MLKLTVFWGQASSRLVGWSENFWSRSFTAINAQSEAAARDLISVCYAAKGKQTINTGFRLSEWNENGTPKRISQLFDVQLTENNPNQKVENDSDYPTIAFLLTGASSTPVRRTQQWFRGVWDDAVMTGGRIRPEVGNQERNEIVKKLNAGWGIRVRQPNVPARVPISSFAAATGTVTTSAAHGLVAEDRVALYGLERSSPDLMDPNQVWTVASVPNATSFVVLGWRISDDHLVFTRPTSKMQKVSYTIATATWSFTRTTSRQVGRPFGSPSGRRAKR